MTDDEKAELERLAGELRQSQTGVMRTALATLRRFAAESRRGNSVGIINGDRIVRELVGPWNDLEPVTSGA